MNYSELDKRWGYDTAEQFREVFSWQNAGGIDAMSSHMYGSENKNPPFDSVESQIRVKMEQAESEGKILFLGEYGYPEPYKEFQLDAREQFDEHIKQIYEQRVPLSAAWNFFVDYDNWFDFDPRRLPHRAYQIETIRDVNRKILSQTER